MDMNSLRDDEKKLALRIADMIELSQKYYKPYYSDFLNELQSSLALRVLSEYGITDHLLWGGYENADRVMLCVYPPYMEPDLDDFPFECVNAKYRKTDTLTHRDFLGSLMSLGIKREVLGDIVVGEGLTSFFVKSELADYVMAQIGKIGKVGVTFTDERIPFGEITQEFEERECTVSSLRIDCAVGAMTNLSRGKAQSLIESGLVVKNFRIICDSDCRVSSGDKISVRGYGKFIVRFDGLLSKKGKYRIKICRLK